MAVHRLVHDSALLRGCAFGDPHLREVFVYEPEGCGGRALPALYALAGLTGSGFGFLNRKWREESLPERLDRLIAGGMPPLRVVMPDGLTALGGAQYMDSAGFGPYSSWLVRELRPWIGERFPTTAWGAVGKSSGGYGSFHLALEHPGVFSAIGAHAPDAGFEYCYPPDFPRAVEDLRAAGGLEAWWQDFRGRKGLGNADHGIVNLLAMSLCYSPEPGATPLPCALPVDLDTGELRQEVFQRWLRFDPVRRVRSGGEALRGVAIWLDAGRRDEFRLQVGARMLHRALEAQGLPHRYEEHGGGHFKLNERLEHSLPFLAEALGRAG